MRIWDRQSGKTEQVLEGHTKGVQLLAYSPDGAAADGKTLVTGSSEGMVRLWNTATGKETGALPKQPGECPPPSRRAKHEQRWSG